MLQHSFKLYAQFTEKSAPHEPDYLTLYRTTVLPGQNGIPCDKAVLVLRSDTDYFRKMVQVLGNDLENSSWGDFDVEDRSSIRVDNTDTYIEWPFDDVVLEDYGKVMYVSWNVVGTKSFRALVPNSQTLMNIAADSDTGSLDAAVTLFF